MITLRNKTVKKFYIRIYTYRRFVKNNKFTFLGIIVKTPLDLNTDVTTGNNHLFLNKFLTLAGDLPKQEYRIRFVLLGPVSYLLYILFQVRCNRITP